MLRCRRFRLRYAAVCHYAFARVRARHSRSRLLRLRLRAYYDITPRRYMLITRAAFFVTPIFRTRRRLRRH